MVKKESKQSFDPYNVSFREMKKELATQVNPIQPIDTADWSAKFDSASKKGKKQMLRDLCQDPDVPLSKLTAMTSSPQVTKFLKKSFLNAGHPKTKGMIQIAKQRKVSQLADKFHNLSCLALSKLSIPNKKVDKVSDFEIKGQAEYEDFCNGVLDQVKRDILSQDDTVARTDAMRQWIQVADNLCERGDYNAAFNVLAGVEGAGMLAKVSLENIGEKSQASFDKVNTIKAEEERGEKKMGAPHILYGMRISQTIDRAGQKSDTGALEYLAGLIEKSQQQFQAQSTPELDAQMSEVLSSKQQVRDILNDERPNLVRAYFNDMKDELGIRLKGEMIAQQKDRLKPEDVDAYVKENKGKIQQELGETFDADFRNDFVSDPDNSRIAVERLIKSPDMVEKMRSGYYQVGGEKRVIDPDNMSPDEAKVIRDLATSNKTDEVERMAQDALSKAGAARDKHVQNPDKMKELAIEKLAKEKGTQAFEDYKNSFDSPNDYDDRLFKKYESKVAEKMDHQAGDALMTDVENGQFIARGDQIGESKRSANYEDHIKRAHEGADHFKPPSSKAMKQALRAMGPEPRPTAQPTPPSTAQPQASGPDPGPSTPAPVRQDVSQPGERLDTGIFVPVDAQEERAIADEQARDQAEAQAKEAARVEKGLVGDKKEPKSSIYVSTDEPTNSASAPKPSADSARKTTTEPKQDQPRRVKLSDSRQRVTKEQWEQVRKIPLPPLPDIPGSGPNPAQSAKHSPAELGPKSPPQRGHHRPHARHQSQRQQYGVIGRDGKLHERGKDGQRTSRGLDSVDDVKLSSQQRFKDALNKFQQAERASSKAHEAPEPPRRGFH